MTFVDDLASRVFGGSAAPEHSRAVLDLPMFSNSLPYRVYEETSRLYLNSRSMGFIVELPPMLGADERTGDIITQFLSEGMPRGTHLQILSWSSPRVSTSINRWFLPRYTQGGVFERMARYRAETLLAGVWKSLSADAPFHTRNHRIIISIGVPSTSATSKAELIALRESLTSAMRSIDLDVSDIDPVRLIALIDDLTSPTTAAEDDAHSYNEYDPIADQAVRRDLQIEVEPDRLLLRTERFRPTGRASAGTAEIGEIYPDRFDVRHFGVKNYPARWAGWTTRELLALKRHRIVSVSLSTLISDFVIAESRSGGSAEQTSARTKYYIAATQSAMKQLSADGTTILVSEAVMSNSVPDYTPVIKAAVAKAMGSAHAGQ